MTTAVSTRTLSRTTGRYVRATPGSQSLARGLALLRAFRPGIGVLTNADLASRTGLPRPTVSRLTHSLVDAGFLDYDHVQRGYRLTVVYLSLALSYRTSQIALDLALPLMRTLAEVRRLNVGLAVLDDAEMVYLDSVRLSRLGVFFGRAGKASLAIRQGGDRSRVPKHRDKRLLHRLLAGGHRGHCSACARSCRRHLFFEHQHASFGFSRA